MTILQLFSEFLNDKRVLTHPQEYLGPNTKKVLEFWNDIEKLSDEEIKIFEQRCNTFYNQNYRKWQKSMAKATVASEKVPGWKYTVYACIAADNVTNSWASYWATLEIISGLKNPVFAQNHRIDINPLGPYYQEVLDFWMRLGELFQVRD